MQSCFCTLLLVWEFMNKLNYDKIFIVSLIGVNYFNYDITMEVYITVLVYIIYIIFKIVNIYSKLKRCQESYTYGRSPST